MEKLEALMAQVAEIVKEGAETMRTLVAGKPPAMA
jgi:hypothetical protein